MISLQHKERLINDAVLLRCAERRSPTIGSLPFVRDDLEQLAGPTITRAMAGRLLGISQPAVDRWIAEGELPAVISPAGRREVPLRPLVDLACEVRERRLEAPGDRHPLAAVLRRRQADARCLDRDVVLPSRYRREDLGGHRRAELRALAYHRVVATRLEDRLVDDVRRRLARWRAEGKIDDRYAQRWEQVLGKPLGTIRRVIAQDTPEARDLRQSSPFAGTLTEQERRRILELV